MGISVFIRKHKWKGDSHVAFWVVVRYDHRTLGSSSIQLPFAPSSLLLAFVALFGWWLQSARLFMDGPPRQSTGLSRALCRIP